MKTVYGAIILIWFGCFLGAQRIATARDAFSIPANSAEITRQPDGIGTGVTTVPPVEPDDSHDPRTDLLGNEVENAVADYRIDRGGAVYERHSPETALPRLGSPSS